MVKHATNKEIAGSIMLYCPFCDFSLYNYTLTFPKMMTHIRCNHLKNIFPISLEDSKRIHKGEAFFENTDYSLLNDLKSLIKKIGRSHV